MILAEDDNDRRSDDRTFASIDRIRREMNSTALLMVECIDDTNRDRIKRAGADVVVRPMRAYPSMIIRSIVPPGSESIIENMFTNQGDEVVYFDVAVQGQWWNLSRIMESDYGILLVYKDITGVVDNPKAADAVNTRGIFVWCCEGHGVTKDVRRDALGQ